MLELKAVLVALKEFHDLVSGWIVLIATNRGYEISPPVCSSMANPVLVHQESCNAKGPAHSGSPKCSGQQVVQVRSCHIDRMVSTPRSILRHLPEVAPSSTGSVCHALQQQTGSIYQSSLRLKGMGSTGSESVLGGPRSICIPPSGNLGQSDGETQNSALQVNHCDHPRVAQHALVLGSGGHVSPNTSVPTTKSGAVDTTIQQHPS